MNFVLGVETRLTGIVHYSFKLASRVGRNLFDPLFREESNSVFYLYSE